MLVPEPLEDALGRVALLPGTLEIIFEDPGDDAGVGLLLSLSKGWDAGAGSASGSPEQASILRTASQCRPNSRAASRMLIPSTIPTRRTRRYTSALYIHRTIRRIDSEPMDGGRYRIQPPNVRNLPPTLPTLPPPRWYTLSPPLTTADYIGN